MWLNFWPHELQHARLPCPSLSPWVCSHLCPLNHRCHPTISSPASSFSCPQSFSAPLTPRMYLPCFVRYLLNQDYCKKCSKHKITYIYIMTLGLLQCFQLGPGKCLFANLGKHHGKMSRVKIGSFLWVLKILRPAWGHKWGLKSLLASRAHLGYKAFMWAQIYPAPFKHKLELPAMRNKNL